MSSSSKSYRRNILVSLIVFFIISFVVFYYKNSKPVLFFEGIIQTVFMIPKKVLYSIGKKGNNDKIAFLTKQNQQLQQKVADFANLKNENEALKSQFVTSGETSQKLVATKIIGFSGDNKYPSKFVINVGKKDGIKKGMAVIFQKTLVGKIDDISQNYSVVITPFNQKFQVLARLAETNANGLLVGKNDFMFLNGVVITDVLTNGGTVVTKGQVDDGGIGVPPDLTIGKIDSISKNDTAPFQSAQVVSIIDYSKLIDVFVINQM